MADFTSRERVLATIHHQKTDRVPVDYAANPEIDRKLKNYFGVDENDTDALLDALDIDMRDAWPIYNGPKLHPDIPERGIRVNEWGDHTRWIEHDSGGYWDFCEFPLADADEEMVANWPMPSPDDYDFSHIAARCTKYKGRAIAVGGSGYGDVINANGRVRSMEQILIDLALDEPAGLLLARRRMEIQLELLARTIEAAGGKHAVDIVCIGEDLGTQIGPMISMATYRKHIKEIHRKFIDLAKSYDLPVMVHTCGSSSWVYPELIEMGVKGVDTLQPEATNMSPSYLFEHFGKDLFFHGAISTTGNLTFGTPEDVRRECRETIAILNQDNSYICCPAHSIQDNSPLENVLALYREAGSIR